MNVFTTLNDFREVSGNRSPEDIVTKVCDIADEAAQILLNYRNNILNPENNPELKIELKSDNSPVTKADRESSELIETRLSQIIPGIAVVSEENDIEPYKGDPYWAIDPLDGTKIFINGGTGFAINIALMINGQPALGVVNCPAHNRAYYTALEMPTYRKSVGKSVTLKNYNNKNTNNALQLRAVFDAVHANKDIYNSQRIKLRTEFGLALPKEPSSERWIQQNMMLIEGLADVHIKTGKDPKLKRSSGSVWDNAADHILLRNSGGRIVDLSTFKPLEYKYGRGKMPAYLAFASKEDRKRFFPSLK